MNDFPTMTDPDTLEELTLIPTNRIILTAKITARSPIVPPGTILIAVRPERVTPSN